MSLDAPRCLYEIKKFIVSFTDHGKETDNATNTHVQYKSSPASPMCYVHYVKHRFRNELLAKVVAVLMLKLWYVLNACHYHAERTEKIRNSPVLFSINHSRKQIVHLSWDERKLLIDQLVL